MTCSRIVATVAIVLACPACDPLRPLGRFPHEVVPRDVPALGVIVVDRDKLVFDDFSPVRDAAGRERPGPQTIFRIGAMTEPITALAAMMLNEEGRLDLDAPVTRYLPEFERARVMVVNGDGERRAFAQRPPLRPILVRHLLTHTSGIASGLLDERLAALDGGRSGDVVPPLMHDPGDRFTYGPNAAVLGRIIEGVAGTSLDVFFQKRIFERLGMRDTSFVVPRDKRSRVATLYVRQNGAWVERPNSAEAALSIRGDTGLFSTTRDYGAFMQLILNEGRHHGTRVIGERAIRAMIANQIGDLRIAEERPFNLELARPFPSGTGKDGFGFGFQIEAAPSRPDMRELGAVSWSGEYNTYFWIDPRRGIGVAVLMQLLPSYDPAAINVLRGFESRVYRVRF
jgi:CubicO group peptidase (beta-lactamase class C family)